MCGRCSIDIFPSPNLYIPFYKVFCQMFLQSITHPYCQMYRPVYFSSIGPLNAVWCCINIYIHINTHFPPIRAEPLWNICLFTYSTALSTNKSFDSMYGVQHSHKYMSSIRHTHTQNPAINKRLARVANTFSSSERARVPSIYCERQMPYMYKTSHIIHKYIRSGFR